MKVRLNQQAEKQGDGKTGFTPSLHPIFCYVAKPAVSRLDDD
jgi:hypothetical protein